MIVTKKKKLQIAALVNHLKTGLNIVKLWLSGTYIENYNHPQTIILVIYKQTKFIFRTQWNHCKRMKITKMLPYPRIKVWGLWTGRRATKSRAVTLSMQSVWRKLPRNRDFPRRWSRKSPVCTKIRPKSWPGDRKSLKTL